MSVAAEDRVKQELRNGGVEAAARALDELLAAQGDDGTGRVTDGALLDLYCMRASLAIVRGEAANVADAIMARVSEENQWSKSCKKFIKAAARLTSTATLTSAEADFQAIVKDHPQFVLAHLGAGAANIARGNHRAAFNDFGQCLQKLGTATPMVVRVGLGVASFNLGKLDHALKCFERALAVDPQSEMAMMGQIAVYLHRRQFSLAVPRITELYKIAPENPVVAQRFADVVYFKLAATGQIAENGAMLLELTRNAVGASSNATIVAYGAFQEARILFAMGELEAARELYNKAIRNLPHLLAARVQLARLEHEVGAFQRSDDMLASIIREKAHQREALQLLALRYSATEQHERALSAAKTLSRAVAVDDPTSFAISAWCNRLDRKAMLEQFRLLAKLSASLSPGQPLDFETRANIAALEGDVAKLEACVVERLGPDFATKPIDVDNVPLIYNLAMALLEQPVRAQDSGARERAFALLKQLVKQHPSFASPYHHLCEAALVAGRHQAARGWMALLRAAHPNDPLLLVNEARALEAEGKREDAARLLLNSRDRSVPVALAAARLYLNGAQGRTSKAAKHLAVARDRFAFALAHDPRNVLAAHGVSCCAAMVEDPNIALVCIDKVDAVVPNDERVKQNISAHRVNSLVKCGLYDLAAGLLRSLPQRSVAESCALAYCLVRRENYADAVAIMRETLEAHPTDAYARYNLILTLWLSVLSAVARSKYVAEAEGAALKKITHELHQLSKDFLENAVLDDEVRDRARRFVRRLAEQMTDLRKTIATLVQKGARELRRSESEAEAWQRTLETQRALMEELQQRKAREQTLRNEAEAERARRSFEGFIARRAEWAEQEAARHRGEAVPGTIDATGEEAAAGGRRAGSDDEENDRSASGSADSGSDADGDRKKRRREKRHRSGAGEKRKRDALEEAFMGKQQEEQDVAEDEEVTAADLEAAVEAAQQGLVDAPLIVPATMVVDNSVPQQ